ncbi:ABC transporter substrate-binding protein [Paenibacillus sp. SYP-B4298]|uniref:ABC transporter substrate-binding protein n=1 Tax=Paenibacillus sp. SYP-B4298 TaxID=2996034 RepID=UPI0022DD71D8|nr:ABC transporter substrate-binding protein [Paenibacillus sp. SYP-B4298]
MSRKPLRIATTNFVAAEYLMALGIAPHASTSLSALEAFPIYQEELSRHCIVDLGGNVDMERLAAVAPDLIIAFDWDRSDYEGLSAIAPTVVFGSKEEVDLFATYLNPIAEATGELAARDTFVARYESASSAAKEGIAEAERDGLSALFLMASSTTLYVYTGWTTKAYYDELGLKRCPGLEGKTTIKWEELPKYDPDILFVAGMYLGQQDNRFALQDNPIWRSLKAVKDGRIYETDASIMGPLAKGQLHGITFIKDMLAMDAARQ